MILEQGSKGAFVVAIEKSAALFPFAVPQLEGLGRLVATLSQSP